MKGVKKGRGLFHVTGDLVFKFLNQLISLEGLKIQTSNFASGFTVRDDKRKNEK